MLMQVARTLSRAERDHEFEVLYSSANVWLSKKTRGDGTDDDLLCFSIFLAPRLTLG